MIVNLYTKQTENVLSERESVCKTDRVDTR
jgi:hypothetical protein